MTILLSYALSTYGNLSLTCCHSVLCRAVEPEPKQFWKVRAGA